MSVIAIKRTKSGFDIVSDSITTVGNTKLSESHKTNGMIIGGCGSSDVGLMRIYARRHKPSSATSEGILDYISEYCEWKQKKTNEYNMDAQFIICFEGKAFSVYDNFDIQEIEDYYAIGWMEHALAAMYLGHSALEAVEVAIQLSVYCYGPTVKFEVYY